MKTHTIIILPDGETWNTISNSSIVVINDKQFKELCEDQIRVSDITPIAEISLTSLTDKWRVRNQACVVCGKARPAGMIMICNQCKERAKNAATEVRT